MRTMVVVTEGLRSGGITECAGVREDASLDGLWRSTTKASADCTSCQEAHHVIDRISASQVVRTDQTDRCAAIEACLSQDNSVKRLREGLRLPFKLKINAQH